MDLHARKAELRDHARSTRKAIPAEERAPLANAAALRALSLPELRAPGRVLGFMAAAEELDPAPLLDALRALGADIVLPRIIGPAELALHSYANGDALETGPFGIRQPGETAPLVESGSVGVVLVPGVAFDHRGRRLGFGGGYYDRLLSRMPHAYTIALAFDGQILDGVPVDDHDMPVHVVVTPTRLLRAPRD